MEQLLADLVALLLKAVRGLRGSKQVHFVFTAAPTVIGLYLLA
jgi:hypothetical protein